MHSKKHTLSDRLVILALTGIFCTGLAVGAVATAATLDRAPDIIVVRSTEETETEKAIEAPAPQEEAAVEPSTTNLGEFKLTAYCTCEKCCGEWADGVTYTGTQATAGRTVAVDPDVIPLGSTVHINGAEYIAEDIGGAIKGNRIDVLCASHEAALQFGVQYADISITK